ncbi:hypothetical protein B0H13DRAFT_2300922 [Mycena leptocephala]|nr:hypothetical protein B0H13DRAFT_2300922 [Mycena leptocephala]
MEELCGIFITPTIPCLNPHWISLYTSRLSSFPSHNPSKSIPMLLRGIHIVWAIRILTNLSPFFVSIFTVYLSTLHLGAEKRDLTQ